MRNREDFFRACDLSRDLCMIYQKAANLTEYLRCYVVEEKNVGIMPDDPRRPFAERHVQEPLHTNRKLLIRIKQDALKPCRALGNDLNTVELAAENGIPYAIDFMNPAPDADLHSVGAVPVVVPAPSLPSCEADFTSIARPVWPPGCASLLQHSNSRNPTRRIPTSRGWSDLS